MGVLGHDLRNPLNLVTGVQQLLKESDNLSEEEQMLLRKSEAGAHRMKELIDNLLELTKLRLGSGLDINPEGLDLTEECQNIIQEFRLTHPDIDFGFRNPGTIKGQWDALRIGQILTNLITNALRHGKPGGPVDVILTCDAENATLQVHNQGNPIKPQICEIINSDNHDNEHSLSKTSGYSLGIFIIKEIVKEHSGQIQVDSRAKNGTTFTVRLPRNYQESTDID